MVPCAGPGVTGWSSWGLSSSEYSVVLWSARYNSGKVIQRCCSERIIHRAASPSEETGGQRRETWAGVPHIPISDVALKRQQGKKRNMWLSITVIISSIFPIQDEGWQGSSSACGAFGLQKLQKILQPLHKSRPNPWKKFKKSQNGLVWKGP